MSLESHIPYTDKNPENYAEFGRTRGRRCCEHETKHVKKHIFLQGLAKHRKNAEIAMSPLRVGYFKRLKHPFPSIVRASFPHGSVVW